LLRKAISVFVKPKVFCLFLQEILQTEQYPTNCLLFCRLKYTVPLEFQELHLNFTDNVPFLSSNQHCRNYNLYKQTNKCKHTALSALQLHSRMHWIHCSMSSSEDAAISSAVGCVGEIIRNTYSLSPRPPGNRSTMQYTSQDL